MEAIPSLQFDLESIGSEEFGDVDQGYESPLAPVPATLLAVLERMSSGNHSRTKLDELVDRVLAGTSLDSVESEARRQFLAARPSMLSSEPTESFMPPNAAQAIVAGLGALSQPRFAANIASTPFRSGLPIRSNSSHTARSDHHPSGMNSTATGTRIQETRKPASSKGDRQDPITKPQRPSVPAASTPNLPPNLTPAPVPAPQTSGEARSDFVGSTIWDPEFAVRAAAREKQVAFAMKKSEGLGLGTGKALQKAKNAGLAPADRATLQTEQGALDRERSLILAQLKRLDERQTDRSDATRRLHISRLEANLRRLREISRALSFSRQHRP